MIMSVVNKRNRCIGYLRNDTPQVRACRWKVYPLPKDSKESGKTRTSMDLCCYWPCLDIARDNQTRPYGSKGGGSFL